MNDQGLTDYALVVEEDPEPLRGVGRITIRALDGQVMTLGFYKETLAAIESYIQQHGPLRRVSTTDISMCEVDNGNCNLMAYGKCSFGDFLDTT